MTGAGYEPALAPPGPEYAARRERLMRELGERAAMILAAAPEGLPGRDVEVRYVPDPNLFYVTGSVEPGTIAVLEPGGEAPFTLFVRPRDPDQERWTGTRPGPEGSRSLYGADAAHPLERFGELMAKLA